MLTAYACPGTAVDLSPFSQKISQNSGLPVAGFGFIFTKITAFDSDSGILSD
jgi:hypothetical protein